MVCIGLDIVEISADFSIRIPNDIVYLGWTFEEAWSLPPQVSVSFSFFSKGGPEEVCALCSV